jgi:hypothetical protein
MSVLFITRKRFLQLSSLSLGAAALGSLNCGSGDSGGAAGSSAGGTTGGAGTGAAGTSAAGTTGAGNAGTNGAAGTTAAGNAGTNGAAGTTGAGGTGGANSCAAAVMAKISGNHGHILMIPVADITAGTMKCYNARGGATHDHWVTVAPADFAMLRAGMTVTKRSCNGGDHQYVLSCAANSPAAVDPGCTAASTEGMTMC